MGFMSTPSDAFAGPVPELAKDLQPDPRRWWALVVIALAELMFVLDASIVNIALPSAQRDLGMSDGNRQWVITAYALAFGGLLLLGGRICDMVGRKRTFVIGLVGFACASAIGGAATGPGMLFASRALQGAFGALLVPATLALLSTTFTDPEERGKAFGIYGAIAGGGSVIGLIGGGLLTEYLSWRWCLYVNIPIAALAVFGAVTVLQGQRDHSRAKLDVPGAALGCSGLLAIVYGFSEAAPRGWTDPLVLAFLIGGVVLLAAFGWWQTKARHPLLPLHVLKDRNRLGCLLTMALLTIGMFGMFLFMSYYMQIGRGYSPVETGLAFLPRTAAIVIGSTQICARLMHRVAPRTLLLSGLASATAGLLLLTRLGTDSPYASHVLPAMCLLGLGTGLTYLPLINTATQNMNPDDTGVTSATLNTAQQVGGSVGVALLNTIAGTSAAAYIAAHAAADQAGRKLVAAQGAVHGYTTAMWWAAAIMVLAAAVAGLMITAKPAQKEAA